MGIRGRDVIHRLCLLFVLAGPPGLAAQDPVLPYVITRWGMEEGLPQSSVNDIIQTRDGYVWIATFGGLTRFDGVQFSNRDRFNTPCMTSDRVLRLFEDTDGHLWVSTEVDLLRFKGNECTAFSFPEAPKTSMGLQVRQDADGRVWAMVQGNVYRHDGAGFVPVPEDRSATQDDGKGIWVMRGNRLFRTSGERLVAKRDLGAFVSNNVIDVAEYPVGSGIVFLATSGSGIFRVDGDEVKRVRMTEREHSRFIWKLHVDNGNQLWALNIYGLMSYDGSRFNDFLPSPELRDVPIMTVLDDNDGNLWIGTSNKGLFQLRPSMIRMIDRTQGLKTEQMLSLTRTPDGRMLFATNCGGVFEWRNGRAVELPVNRYLPNLCVWSVFADSKGRYWFGSRVPYVTESLDKPGIHLELSTGFPVTDVNAITEDRQSNIWFGSLYGAVKYDGLRYVTFTTENGLSHNDVRTLYQDREGRMWLGTVSGVNLIEGGMVKRIYLVAGQGERSEPYVRAIHQDEDGVMWFGTYGNGLFRWENGEVTNIRKEHGLADNIVSHLVDDGQGNFWSGSNNGIFRTGRAELNAFHAGRITRISSDVFGVRDGMNSSETNGGFQPNVMADADGNVYFPTVEGVAVVSTRDSNRTQRVPPVFITAIRSDRSELDISDLIELPHNSAYLEIEYTALHYRDAKKLRFRYRMEGLENTWIDVGERRAALFTKLPPGEYTFTVTASTDGVNWAPTGASIRVRVVPPFWATTPFRAAMVLLFLLAGPIVYVSRVNRLKAEQEKQRRFTEQLIESQENERRRIAAELHDGLGQQILVIKNRAELAQGTTHDPDQTAHHLNEIMHSAMSSISDVRSITHDLRPVHLERFGLTDSLNSLCDDIRQTAKLECSYQIDDIDDFIPQDRQIHFYRVIQEGLTNIMKHSKAEHASLFIRRTESGIRAMLWDDGIGFDVNVGRASDGLGLSGMQERMLTLGGTITFHSDPDEGTTLTLTIPASTHG